MWKGTGNIITLLFSLKELEIVYQEGRRLVNNMVMEYFKSSLFHTTGPANKQHNYKSVSQLILPLFSTVVPAVIFVFRVHFCLTG